MALSKVKIGVFVELYKEKCNIPNLSNNDVSGINRDKEFFEPSTQVANDTSNYKIVPPNYYACNLMHVGRDVVLPISYNLTLKNKVVSPAYTVFKLKDESIILNEYFFMMLKSKEKDRFFWFHTDSSVRDGMDWSVFTELELEIPPIEIQRKYVAIYKALQDNLKVYQSKLDDLKLVCDGYIENLRKKYPSQEIGGYIQCTDKKNNNVNRKIVGISNSHKLIPSDSRTMGVDVLKYNELLPNEFAYSPIHINDGSIAINNTGNTYAISPIYKTFKTSSDVVPMYFMLWFSRNEFVRYCWFNAFGSARDTFDWENFKQVQIPIPPIEIQNNIVAIFDAYNKRKEFVEKLKKQINNICPILIRGAILESKNDE